MHLQTHGLVGENARFRTLYGGRSNQVWKVLGGDADRVLKLYRTAMPNPLFRNDAQLEASLLQALGATGFVPRLRSSGHHRSGQWVFYDHAPGLTWRTNPAPVAQMLHRLHRLDLDVAAPDGCNGSHDLDQHGQRILADCSAAGAAKIQSLRPTGPLVPPTRRRLIHGDPVPGNLLVAETGITLIDWQCPVWGDPCEDLAVFLSPAMQYLYRGEPLTKEEETEFLNAYGCRETVSRFRELQPWYGWRMAAYCLWRIENGAPDYATGLELELAAL